jgi:hypothetical protein
MILCMLLDSLNVSSSLTTHSWYGVFLSCFILFSRCHPSTHILLPWASFTVSLLCYGFCVTCSYLEPLSFSMGLIWLSVATFSSLHMVILHDATTLSRCRFWDFFFLSRISLSEMQWFCLRFAFEFFKKYKYRSKSIYSLLLMAIIRDRLLSHQTNHSIQWSMYMVRSTPRSPIFPQNL